MTFPVFTVEFSPTTGPFEAPVWISLSDDGPHGNRVLEAEWTDGKQADLAEFPAGQATVVLDNADRLFDPEHAAGDYFGNLNPRVPFRIRATRVDALEWDGDALDWDGDALEWSHEADDLFYGFVEDGWEQTGLPPANGTCTVKLVDLVAVLKGYTLPSVFGAAVMALNPVGYWPLTEAAGAASVGDKVGANDGDVVGEVEFAADPLAAGLGTSARFNGVNDRVDISRSWLWDRTHEPWSVVAVIRTDTPAEASSEHPIFLQVAGNSSADIDMVNVTTDGTVQRYMSRGGAGSVVYNATAVDDDEPHIVFAQNDTGAEYGVAVDSATLEQNGTVGAAQSGNGVAIGGTPFAAKHFTDNQFDGILSHVAAFDYALDAAERQTLIDAYAALDGASSGEQIVWALEQIGVPATMYDIDTGVSVMGPAITAGVDALAFMRGVASAEQGGLYVAHHDGGKLRFRDRYASFQDTRSIITQVTFSDDATAVDDDAARVDPDTLIVEPNGVSSVINQTTVSWAGGEETVDESAGSPYGPRPVDVSTEASSPLIARSVGQWIIANNAVPSSRVRALGVDPGSNHTDFAAALRTRIGDRAAYRAHPQAVGSATTQQLEVLGRHHHVSDVSWLTTFYLTKAPADGVDLFTLGTSELGDPDILAY